MAVADDYQAVRERAGLFDGPVWGLIEVRGADRAAFLHNLLTQDIRALAAGSGAEAALVTPAAKLLATLVVLAESEAHWLIAPRDRIEAILKTLDRYRITEDVTLADRRNSHEVLALQGPRSPAILREFPDPARQAAYSFTGEPGALLIVPVEQTAAVSSQLREYGAVPVGWEALEIARIEAGVPWFGVDMDETTLLPETGLERVAVSSTKGCYVGQEIIARVQTYGAVSRKLTGLVVDGPDVPRPRDLILADGQPAGHITSACWSPLMARPIALGYVKRPLYAAGTRVAVTRGDRRLAATVATLPFAQGS